MAIVTFLFYSSPGSWMAGLRSMHIDPYTHGHKCAETIGTQIGTKSPALFYLHLSTLAPTIAHAFTLHRYRELRHSALFASHSLEVHPLTQHGSTVWPTGAAPDDGHDR